MLTSWLIMKRGDIHYCSITQGGVLIALG